MKPKLKIWQAYIFIIVSILICSVQVNANPSENPVSTSYVKLDGPVSTEEVTKHIDYYLDTDWSKSALDMVKSETNNFSRFEGENVNFGFTKDLIWLRFGIENQMMDNEQWRIHFKENFFQEFDVFVVYNSNDLATPKIEHILSLDKNSDFLKRPVAYPELVAPLQVNNGEKVTILVAYWSEGSSQLDIAVETVESFSDTAIKRLAKNFISYGMMSILILAACIAFVALRRKIFLAYIAYAVSTLLFLIHADGVGFQYLWPKFPQFNSSAAIYFGSGVVILTIYYSRIFLNTKHHHPLMDKMILSFIIMVLVTTIGGFFINPQWLKKTLILFSLLAVIFCTIGGLVAGIKRFKEVRFYIIAWSGAVISGIIMNLRHYLGFDISQDTEFDAIRVAMVFDASMMGLAIADRFNQLRKSRQNAMKDSLANAKRNLELNSRLYGLEEQYKLAVEMVRSRDEELQNTVHDLRQPLNALRLNIENLRHANSTRTNDEYRIDETFSYLETLIAGHLQNTAFSSEVNETDRIQIPIKVSEDMPLTIPSILETIYEMFLPDAIEKELTFKYIKTEYDTKIDPLVLMRIITNLVSNAIKYTHDGEIIVLTRKSPKKLSIEVQDTGVGMSIEEFEQAKNRKARLQKNQTMIEGYGYGLSIASTLSQKHGLDLSISPNTPKGTIVTLEIPTS